jgi:hypothetical protein
MRKWLKILSIPILGALYFFAVFIFIGLLAVQDFPWHPYTGKGDGLVIFLVTLEHLFATLTPSAVMGCVIAALFKSQYKLAVLTAALPAALYMAFPPVIPKNIYSALYFSANFIYTLLPPLLFAWLMQRLIFKERQ